MQDILYWIFIKLSVLLNFFSFLKLLSHQTIFCGILINLLPTFSNWDDDKHLVFVYLPSFFFFFRVCVYYLELNHWKMVAFIYTLIFLTLNDSFLFIFFFLLPIFFNLNHFTLQIKFDIFLKHCIMPNSSTRPHSVLLTL